MASNKTRFSSSERRNLIMNGIIRPSTPAIQVLTEEQKAELRVKGRKACSRIDAIMSRRRELGLA